MRIELLVLAARTSGAIVSVVGAAALSLTYSVLPLRTSKPESGRRLLLLMPVLSRVNVEPGPTETYAGSWKSAELTVAEPAPAVTGATLTFTGSMMRPVG